MSLSPAENRTNLPSTLQEREHERPAEALEQREEEERPSRRGPPRKADPHALPGQVREEQDRLAQRRTRHNPLYDRTALQHHLVQSGNTKPDRRKRGNREEG